MATLIRVFEGGTKNLLFTRLFPDGVPASQASEAVKDYIITEGLNKFFSIDRTTSKVTFSKYVLKKPLVFGAAEHSAAAHIEKDGSGNSFCGLALFNKGKSDIKYKETCLDCADHAGII
jgi:hypothetical protein